VLILFTYLYSRQCSLGAESAEAGTVRAVQTSLDVFIFIDSKFSLSLSVIWPSWVFFHSLAPDRGHMNSDLSQLLELVYEVSI
jgi:hypothetical protein